MKYFWISMFYLCVRTIYINKIQIFKKCDFREQGGGRVCVPLRLSSRGCRTEARWEYSSDRSSWTTESDGVSVLWLADFYIPQMAVSLSGVGPIPVGSTVCSRNSKDGTPKEHFAGLNVRPWSERWVNSWFNTLTC